MLEKEVHKLKKVIKVMKQKSKKSDYNSPAQETAMTSVAPSADIHQSHYNFQIH